MTFPLDLYLVAFLASGVTTALVLPLWRKWCYRTGLVDDPGHRKIHGTPTALAGGLAVLTGLILPLLGGLIALAVRAQWFAGEPGDPVGQAGPSWALLAAEPVQLLKYGFDRRGLQLAAILLGALAMAALGWWDDKHELRAATKFGGQLLIAGLVAAAGVRITLFVDNLGFSYAITVLWILTVTNAFNFMDNMNGLCAGLGAISAWLIALSAAGQGQYLVTLLALLACGALLGFLPFNFPKASAFLGDAGSHLTGFLLAVLAILPHFYSKENPNTWAVLNPLLILAVPLADLIWVVLLRWRLGQPFYVGDNNHLSHRLVRRGWSRTQAVLLIWLMAAGLGTLCFLPNFFGNPH
jgi:UDP-GlcNAc:undecaprenyl-phosphate GlcNAc-1-phosphate transferase